VLPASSLERRQHYDGVGQAGRVDHSIRSRVVPDSDLLNALAHRRHRLEVVRLPTALHLVELVTGIVPSIVGKLAQALERVAEEADRLHGELY
jgi:hypothetical protein